MDKDNQTIEIKLSDLREAVAVGMVHGLTHKGKSVGEALSVAMNGIFGALEETSGISRPQNLKATTMMVADEIARGGSFRDKRLIKKLRKELEILQV